MTFDYQIIPEPRIREPTISPWNGKSSGSAFTVLGLLADFLLPLWWGLAATIPIISSRGGSPTAANGFEGTYSW